MIWTMWYHYDSLKVYKLNIGRKLKIYIQDNTTDSLNSNFHSQLVN